MSKRTKRKIQNIRLFLTKNVFNSRFIVRNILAITVFITCVAVCVGTVNVIGSRKPKAQGQTEASGKVEEVQTLDGSICLMNAEGTNVIRADLEENITADKEAKEKEVVAAAANEFANKCVANEDEINVRAEATTESDVVGRMKIGACADIVSQTEDWVEITSGDVKGFVKKEYVTIGKDAYELAQEYYTATAIVTEDGVCLRADASKEADVLGAVYEDVTYPVNTEKTTKEWVCVQTEAGGEGYVSADFMEVTEGYRVAEVCAEETEKNEETEEQENTTEEETTESETSEEDTKKSEGSVKAVETTATTVTTVTTTEATTQAAPAENTGVTCRGSITLSDADVNLMAAVMTLECGAESYEGQLAVANVILNRLQSGRWGSTISDVVYAPSQFSVVSDPRLQSLITNGAQASCVQAARDACAGNNNIGDMNAFRPTWNVNTSNLSDYKQIGNHVFFRN